MTVVDSSVVVDFLVGRGPHDDAVRALQGPGPAIAPDILVFEVVSALRRMAMREGVPEKRAAAAVADLGDLRVDLVPSLVLRHRAWELRHNFGIGDALFVALAEQLGEPLATRDHAMAAAARRHARVETVEL